MSKTLVILLSETRASELTYDNMKKNLIDELNADLCVCIGVKPDYDYTNPFYQLAKYKFTYDEPDDFGDAFDYAYNIISANQPKYECLKNINALHGKLKRPQISTPDITYYGTHDKLNLQEMKDDIIVVHQNEFPDKAWKNQVYGIHRENHHFVHEQHVNTYKKHLHWREFLKIKDQFLGGIKDVHQHPGSAGILIFFRWFLLKNLMEHDLLHQYDRFIITRSDFMYQMPHSKLEWLDPSFIWIPDSEHYGGYTDRHVVLSPQHVEPYLNILNTMVLRSNEYFMKMKSFPLWNLERLIFFHLGQNHIRHMVKEFPYVMYSVRNIHGSTRWSEGVYSDQLGYYVKYITEYDKSSVYKNNFNHSGLTLENFYKKIIKEMN